MATQIQRATDLSRVNQVWALTYNSGRAIPEDQNAIEGRHDEVYEALIDNEIAGAFSVMPMLVTRGNASFRCAGIASVAVMPHARNSGIGALMMRHAVREYAANGFQLAALYAFSERFYGKFGYAVAGFKYSIKVDMGRFPKFKQTLPVTVRRPNEVELIKPTYEQFAHRRSGMNLRPQRHWDRIIQPDSNKVIYTVGDPIEAYAVVQHDATFWNEQPISELVWTTRAGYESILAVIAGIGINKTHVSWSEPSDSPYRAMFWDRGAEVNPNSGHLCWRVLNVPQALAGLKPSHSGSFSLMVQDEILPENNGPWLVEFSESGVKVSRTDHAELIFDIRQFSQAFMGEPSVRELAANDLISVNNEKAVKEMSLLLPHSPTMCLDAF